MTNHLSAVSMKEHQQVLDIAREFADRAEAAEAEVERLKVENAQLREQINAQAMSIQTYERDLAFAMGWDSDV